METFFTITLIVSAIGMITLMVLKQIELSTGVVILASIRPRVNRFFKIFLLIIERGLPALLREGFIRLFRKVRAFLTRIFAHGILWFEVTLKKLLKVIREKTHPAYTRGEASPFLKEVGEYKKQLESESKDEAQKF